jgi:hypothetical protein
MRVVTLQVLPRGLCVERESRKSMARLALSTGLSPRLVLLASGVVVFAAEPAPVLRAGIKRLLDRKRMEAEGNSVWMETHSRRSVAGSVASRRHGFVRCVGHGSVWHPARSVFSST